MLVNSTAANGYGYIDSDSFPRLLDLRGKTISFKSWAYPSTANDAFLTVAYEDEDGTETTANSITACPANVFTLLEKEGVAVPDDITKIGFRCRVKTSGKNAYFDSARVTGMDLKDYLLPETLQDGEVKQVYIQTDGNSDDICDDLHPRSWDRVFGYSTYNDGTYEWIRLPSFYSKNRQIGLIGTSPLSTVTNFTDTTQIDGKEVDLLTAYAAFKLFMKEEGVPSSEDTGRYTKNQRKYLDEYNRLKPSLRMIQPRGTMKLPKI